MTKTEFEVCKAWLDISTNELAAALGVAPCKISVAFGSSPPDQPWVKVLRGRVKTYLDGLLEFRRMEVLEALAAQGCDENVQVFLPTDCYTLVAVNGLVAGYFNIATGKIMRIDNPNIKSKTTEVKS